jgi:hypothetical protein
MASRPKLARWSNSSSSGSGIIKYIGPPINTRAYIITRWLRGEGQVFGENAKEGALRFIAPKDIWHWVEQDIQKRARYLASFVPPILFKEDKRFCLAAELLRRYGDREEVRHSLMANFSTEGWSGPASLHYQNKKQELLEFEKGQDNPNVRIWIDDYICSLEKQIENEKIQEERED